MGFLCIFVVAMNLQDTSAVQAHDDHTIIVVAMMLKEKRMELWSVLLND